jgi:hypothetical protein
LSLCLAAGAVAASLAIDSFTLAGSIPSRKSAGRKTGASRLVRWCLPKRASAAAAPAWSRPPVRVLKNGVWHYRPALPPQAVLRLAHSPHAGGYTLCTASVCAPLADHLPGIDNTATIELRECPP